MEFEIADKVPELVNLFRIPLSLDISDKERNNFVIAQAEDFQILGDGKMGDNYNPEIGELTTWIEAPRPAEVPHPPGGWRGKEIKPIKNEMAFTTNMYTSEGQGTKEISINFPELLNEVLEKKRYKNTPEEIVGISEKAVKNLVVKVKKSKS